MRDVGPRHRDRRAVAARPGVHRWHSKFSGSRCVTGGAGLRVPASHCWQTARPRPGRRVRLSLAGPRLSRAAGPRPGLALTAPGLRDFVRQTPTQTLTLTWASLAAGAWSQTVLKAPPGRAGPAAGAAAPPALPPPSPRQ